MLEESKNVIFLNSDIQPIESEYMLIYDTTMNNFETILETVIYQYEILLSFI
jgi:hypothetical protein